MLVIAKPLMPGWMEEEERFANKFSITVSTCSAFDSFNSRCLDTMRNERGEGGGTRVIVWRWW